MDPTTSAAFDRLLARAQGDSGQCRRIANFLLAWWNAEELGAFDLADLFAVDAPIADDMAKVFAFLGSTGGPYYPEHRRLEIEILIQLWRPAVWARSQEPA